MTIEELRDKTVELGIQAAKRDYGRPDQAHKLRGSLGGFSQAKALAINWEQFEAVISSREAIENQMRRNQAPEKEFWEHRCATAEIDWVYQVLRCAWRMYPLSGRAMSTYQQIVIESEQSV
jgi:hypothetical protein